MSYTRRRILQVPAALAVGSYAAGSQASEVAHGESVGLGDLPRGEFYVDLDDIRMYCEVRGEGPLLIHQTGVWTVDSKLIMEPVDDALSKHFTVLTMDARGQGRTTLGKGPTTYTRVAADTTRLMDELKIDQAHFFGISDGGCIQLKLLLNFEERVKSASLCGTPYSHDAYTPAVKASFELWRQEMLADSEKHYGLDGEPQSVEALEQLRARYESVSPHPELFSNVMKERRRCWATEPDMSLKRLSAIQRPVLVINAGADEYIPKSAFDALEKAIPGSESVHYPDMTHVPYSHAVEIADAVAAFTSQHS